MLLFQNLPIRRKQRLILMLTSGLTLLLACAAFVTYDALTFRQQLFHTESSVAELIGQAATTAIEAHDQTAAEKSLAVLRGHPNVVAAGIYGRTGKLFATYQRKLETQPHVFPEVAAGHQFIGNQLILFQDIMAGNTVAGTVYIVSDLTELSTRVGRYASIVGVGFLVSLLLAWGLSSRLQRVIADPILHLAQLSRAVAVEKNYSLRANKTSEDELGQLVDGFNEMLNQIQQRDAALLAARDQLEHRVAERTAELAESLSVLNATLGSAVDGILVVNPQGKKIFRNQRVMALWKIPVAIAESDDDEAQVQHVLHLVVEPDKFLAKIKYFYTHPAASGQDEIELSDGTILDRTTAPVLGADGRNYGRIWMFRDVTQSRRNEVALRESEALYYSLVDQLPIGIFRKDNVGRFVFVNAWFCSLKGLDAEQILGKTPLALAAYELTRHSDPDLAEEPVTKWALLGDGHHQTIMRTGQTIEMEEDYPDSNGIQRYVRVIKFPALAADGTIIGSQGLLIDITERKRTEAELAYERDLLRELLNNAPDQIYFKDLQSRYIKASKSQSDHFGVKNIEEIIGKTDFDFFTKASAQAAYEEEQEIIRTGRPPVGKVQKQVLSDGRVAWALTNKMPMFNQAGKVFGTFGIFKDITAIKMAETALAYERDLLRTLMDSSPDHIYFKDREGRFLKASRSAVEDSLLIALSRYYAEHPADTAADLPPHLTSWEQFHAFIIGKTDAEIYGADRVQALGQDEAEIFRTGQPIIGKIEQMICPDGRAFWFMTTKMPWRNNDGEIIGTVGSAKNITAIKEAEGKLKEVHQQLIETSRLAGMAEVATNVLHNVGNVLNSVNVSSTLVFENAKKSKIPYLAKVVALLEAHAADLGAFFANDPKGRQLPGYLSQLAGQLANEQSSAINELSLLRQNLEHIKDIVAMQQSYAKISGVTETMQVTDMVEDALRMNAGALIRHEVELIREYASVPAVTIEKHKVLQILVNLIRNAKYACDDAKRQDKKLRVQIAPTETGVQIAIIDNGVGIPAENLTRIFSHGFTTRKLGHGFGLHSGALAAKELGGTLTAHSKGPGQGATFILQLPLQPPKTEG